MVKSYFKTQHKVGSLGKISKRSGKGSMIVPRYKRSGLVVL
jgi:hypothetical protein